MMMIEQLSQLVDDPACYAGWDHHPNRARLFQLADELFQSETAGRALTLELLDGIGIRVKHDTFMPVAH
jgi:hypothetical protein